MSMDRDIKAMDISGDCHTWAQQFANQERLNVSDERLAEMVHDMVLDFQKVERRLRRQAKAVER